MATKKVSRKQRFRAALALAGLTMAQWAKREDLSPSYVSQVLGGKMESKRLNDRIDEFTRETLISTTALVA